MFTSVPKSLRVGLETNVTIEDLNDILVHLHYPAIIFIAVLMIVGVVGNVFLIYVYTTKYPQSSYRSFILWLGWIDLIACIVGMPLLIVSMLYPYMLPSEIACKTLPFLHVFLVVSSAFIVIAIAIERHRRICQTFPSERIPIRIKKMCSVASALGCLVAIPAVFIYGGASVDTGVHNITGIECFIDPDYEHSFLPKIYLIFLLTLTIISAVVIGILYFRIGVRIYHHHQFIRENTYNGQFIFDDKCDKPAQINNKASEIDKDTASTNESQLKKSPSVKRTKSTNNSVIQDIDLLNNPFGDDMYRLYSNFLHESSKMTMFTRGTRETDRLMQSGKTTIIKTNQQKSTIKMIEEQSDRHVSTMEMTNMQTTTKHTNSYADRHVTLTKLTNEHADRELSMTKLANEHAESQVSMTELSNEHADRQVSRTKLTNEHADRQVSMTKLANEHADRQVSMTKLTNEHADRQVSMSNLANMLTDRQVSMTNLANIQAERQVSMSNLANIHADRRVSMCNLANMHADRQVSMTKLTNEHADTQVSMNKLANMHADRQVSFTKMTTMEADRHRSMTKLANVHVDRQMSVPKLNKQTDRQVPMLKFANNLTDRQETPSLLINKHPYGREAMSKLISRYTERRDSMSPLVNSHRDRRESSTTMITNIELDQIEPMTKTIKGQAEPQEVITETNLEAELQEATDKEVVREIDQTGTGAKVNERQIERKVSRLKERKVSKLKVINKLGNVRKNPVKGRPSLRTKQIMFMLFMIPVLFVLSFIPHLALLLLKAFNPSFFNDMSPIEVSVYNVFLRSFVINNVANPIIYGFCDKKFRSECVDCVFRC